MRLLSRLLLLAACLHAQTLKLSGPASVPANATSIPITVSISGTSGLNLSAVGWTLNIVTGKSASGSGKLVGTPVPILAVAGKNVTCSYVGALANFNSSTAPPQPGPIAIIDDLTSTGVGSCQKTTGPVAYKFADGVIATLTIAAPLLAAGGTQMYFLVNTMGLAPDMAACTPIAGSLQIPAVCTDDVLINNGGFASASYVVGAGK